jgi:thiamine-phosphate pyrophosphorylase
MKGLLFIISTNMPSQHDYLTLAKAAIAGGVDSIQFRHKGEYNRQMLSIAQELSQLCQTDRVPFVINDRVDVALMVDASGVHLGQEDMPISNARKILGQDKIIGLTASNVSQAMQAEKEGADYIGLGHIYETNTKIKAYPPIGLETLKTVCEKVRIPVFAIGGIKLHHVNDVMKMGPTGVAVVTAISDHDNPQCQTQAFKKMLC